MNDLFSLNLREKSEDHQPLAERMRPEKLEDFIGQRHLVGKGKLINRLIEADRLTSLIFYGPPGTGKTSLASIIAKTTEDNFYKLSAVTAGVKDIKQIIDIAEEELKIYNKKTILFVDEIHRFNKSQQDVLLPYVERGLIILIGATTENPLFEVNKALLSRSRVLEFKLLDDKDLEFLLKRVLSDKEKGYGNEKIVIDDDSKYFLIKHMNGDARNLINTLELAFVTSDKNELGKTIIDIKTLKNIIQRVNLRYDKTGDQHYDIISAFIKSIRGSQVDPALYYLALMLESGEDPKFIARRLIISAAEDIGLADPQALTLANSAFDAVNYIGMPEARIVLSEITIYLASAPKSNSAYLAINEAIDDVRKKKSLHVPKNLKNISIGKREESEKYKYNHNYDNQIARQDYLEGGIEKSYYKAKDIGYESNIRNRLGEISRLYKELEEKKS